MDKILDKEIQYNKLQILGKLTASLAHEIRNPLSALKLNLDFLTLSSEHLNAEENECLKACIESADRIQNLMETTLDFSRRPSKDFNLCNLNEIIHQALEILDGAVKRRNIKVEQKLSHSLPHLNLNKNMILQVILNLITNAIDASENHSTIFLRTFIGSGDIHFEVEDNGVGIKEEDKTNIFTDFYTSKTKGTGLGLSVCKMLLNIHSAKIDFRSTEGKGSCFYVTFPKQITEDYNET
ncbi:MAG: HAMP domain-containing histidine kinase [Ignavibacteria bacterium]|nr:HAMP domain-containing histidine kinase [Ignavibacteria bacterium]